MSIRNQIKQIIKKTTGISLFKILPFGMNPYNDLKFQMKDVQLSVFFDVGANIGQTVEQIKSYFPKSKIYCFEPVKNTFEILNRNVSHYNNINTYQIALGSSNSKVNISLNNNLPSMNSLVNNNEGSESEMINVNTLDNFCNHQNIYKINYLKIDTEGFDLEVLKGAEKMLQKQQIDFVEVEVSMNPENNYHISLFEIKNFLEQKGYRIYGIYDQVHEWQKKIPILRRVNSLFIAENIYIRSKGC